MTFSSPAKISAVHFICMAEILSFIKTAAENFLCGGFNSLFSLFYLHIKSFQLLSFESAPPETNTVFAASSSLRFASNQAIA